MTHKGSQSAPNEGVASALPRPPRLGPGGRTARLAAAHDEDALASLLEALSREESPPPDPDLVRWATQTLLRRPVHGFVALVESDSAAVEGVAVVSVHLDPVRGWTGELVRFWISPEGGDPRTSLDWFLEEVLEMARYHGINRVRLPGDLAAPLASTGAKCPEWLVVNGEWAALRPHFDTGPEPEVRA